MSAMSQLYTDTQAHLDEVRQLRWALKDAASRFRAIADNTEPGPLRELYKKWEMEAREAVENV